MGVKTFHNVDCKRFVKTDVDRAWKEMTNVLRTDFTLFIVATMREIFQICLTSLLNPKINDSFDNTEAYRAINLTA